MHRAAIETRAGQAGEHRGERAGTAAHFEPHVLRRVLGTFATGVTVVTTIDGDGRPHGLTVNSFNAVSLDPPLILWSQSQRAPSHPVFRDAPCFAVHILAADQVALSQRFASAGAAKFERLVTTPGLGGVPLIDGCVARLECRREAAYPGGDHVIFVGRIERIAGDVPADGAAGLVFAGGRYRSATAPFDALRPSGTSA